jgi:PAS domain S-box-containing protein
MEFCLFVGEEEHWYSARVVRLPNANLLFIARDVSKARQVEGQLRQVVEWAPTGMILVARDGAINLLNSQAERLFGYRRDELIGRPIEVLLPHRYRADHPSQRQKYFSEPTARAMGSGRDLMGLRKNGTEFPVEVGLNPLPGKEGGLVLASIIDITERKRDSAELAARAAELARSNGELQQFAYVASHDLQEPLRMVASYLELLAKRYQGRLDERADKFIAYAVDGATRMQALIDDLLVYSRVSARGTPLVPTNCNEVFRQAVANLGPRIAESGAAVTSDDLPTVEADPVQLLQLFQNLVGNAVKFCEGRPVVHVAAERRGGEWRFGVRDNGIGIAPEHSERIFQIFQRLHTRTAYSGTGIGLAVCKKVVERHGGRIAVAPAPGGGSEFSFTLPVNGKGGHDTRDEPTAGRNLAR